MLRVGSNRGLLVPGPGSTDNIRVRDRFGPGSNDSSKNLCKTFRASSVHSMLKSKDYL